MKKLLALAFLFFAGSALAAPTVINTFVAPTLPNRGVVQFLQGTDAPATFKTLYTGATNGSDCNAMWMTNLDPSATHLVTIEIVNSAVKYGGTALTTVIGAGFLTGVPAQNLMTASIWPGLPLDQKGNPYIRLISGDTLQATYATALTSTAVISIVATCADYQ